MMPVNSETNNYLNTKREDIINKLDEGKDFGYKSSSLVRILELDTTPQSLSRYLENLLCTTKIRKGNSETYKWILRKYRPLINMKLLKGEIC